MADGLYGPIWIKYVIQITLILNERHANQNSPKPGSPQPFELISKNEDDLRAMRRAEANPRLVVLSDWDHLTSEEYQGLQEYSGLDIL